MKATRFISILSSFWILSGCVTGKSASQTRADDRRRIQQELGQEMSLKADREALQNQRQEVPTEKQKRNDELALFLNLMSQGKENPSLVRDRFNSLVQQKRTEFRQKVERLRADFRAEETRRREDFMSAQQKKRDSFFAKRREAKESARFSGDLDRQRIRFFADERDRRSAFESEVNVQSKDFESYMRERQNQFNEQFRLYSKELSEKPKEKKAATGDDFKRLEQAPANPLGTDD